MASEIPPYRVIIGYHCADSWCQGHEQVREFSTAALASRFRSSMLAGDWAPDEAVDFMVSPVELTPGAQRGPDFRPERPDRDELKRNLTWLRGQMAEMAEQWKHA